MIDERGIAFRYLRSQKKRSILMIFGVVLAIALISALFSLLNAVQEYEVTSQSMNGIWHIQVSDCTKQQADGLARRLDVSGSGNVAKVQEGVSFNGKASGFINGCDSGGVKQLNLALEQGSLPHNNTEIVLEQWAAEKLKPGARIGDTVNVTLGDKTEKTYTISGFFKSKSTNKANAYYLGVVSLDEGKQLAKKDTTDVLMTVKDGININKFIDSIVKDQNLDKKAVGQHTGLLGALGRSDARFAIGIYLVGAFLALLVIFSAIMMIFNSFNISVTQRVRQFGLLRATGATPSQIRKIVRSESLLVSLFGVLPGLLLGVIVTNCLIAFLRFTVPEYFPPEGPAIYISWISLFIGVVTGVLTTVISALAPARKAGRVSPVQAMSVTDGKAVKKKSARGITTKLIPIESALAVRRVTSRKRSFLLTALSLSFGILLILTFNPITQMLYEGTQHNYDLGDMYAMVADQNQNIPDSFVQSVSKLEGVQEVYPKRIATIDATFDYNLLGNDYRDSLKVQQGWKTAEKGSDGNVKPNNKSTMIGITDNDLRTLRSKLVFGSIDPQQLNKENGVVLVLNQSGFVNVGDLRPGNFIYIGSQKVKICGVIKNDSLIYVNQSPFIGVYTTNSVFDKYTSGQPKIVTMKLKNAADSETVFNQVKGLAGSNKTIEVVNQGEAQAMAQKINLVANVFIYGFIGVIALIGILNIINTMSTNILVRTREIGLLRAGGMTMGQITAMVVSEAVLYGILALVIGLVAGIPLEHYFYNLTIKETYAIPWTLPWPLALIASLITVVAIFASVISPLRYIKKIEITQAVTVE